jgi:replicative DNA helicase
MAATKGNHLTFGFPKTDHFLRPARHRYFVLASRPGMFKTTLAWNLAINMAMQGRRVLWLGVELPPCEMAAWASSRISGLALERMTDHAMGSTSLLPSEELLLLDSQKTVQSLPLVMWPHESLTLSELIQTSTAIPYDVVFLDYVQLVQAPGHRTETERVTAVSEKIREIKRTHPLLFVVLSQMNREIEKHTSDPKAKPRLPQLSDLKSAGQLEQDGDAVAFLHRLENDSDENHVDLRIVKNRWAKRDVCVSLRAHPETKFIEEDRRGEPFHFTDDAKEEP